MNLFFKLSYQESTPYILEKFDIVIIGGGINGCGIARDAAGRGLKVLICEKNDLGSATSSSSTKLIHGGLRYLETFQFRLVKEALQEREILLNLAPHIISEMRFILPHQQNLRPSWLIRIGLFLYDNLGSRKLLNKSKFIDLTNDVAGNVLKESYNKGFEYSDCWVDDSRLVILNAQDAHLKGAKVLPRTSCVNAVAKEGKWNLTLREDNNGNLIEIESKAIINATGPWSLDFLAKALNATKPNILRLVRGSHILVPKQFDHDKSYIFQNNDKRIIFAIPYEQSYTLIGTTDVEHKDGPDNIKISAEEIQYLCDAVNLYFKTKVQPTDILHSYSGVRPLLNDGAENAQTTTRDYSIELDLSNEAPLLNVFGGKITTYRKLAEVALSRLNSIFNIPHGSWTSNAPLPGGDFKPYEFNDQKHKIHSSKPWLEKDLLGRLFSSYGTNLDIILNKVNNLQEMGQYFGAGLYECEINYLRRFEWAQTADDILWRRSKLGLVFSKSEYRSLEQWLKSHPIPLLNT